MAANYMVDFAGMKVEIQAPQKASNHTKRPFFFPFSTHSILHKNGKWTATLLGLFRFVLMVFKYNFIYLFLAVLGLRCCAGFSLLVMSRGYSPAVGHGFLTEAASLVAGPGF